MKYAIWTISSLLAILALFASADTVYMTDGTQHHGRVTRQGSQYVITPASGAPVVVESADVDKIIPDSTEGPSVAAPEATAPATSAPVAPALFGGGISAAPVAAAGGATAALSAVVRWSIENATLAEPIVFMVCRQTELSGSGATAGVQQHLDQYRAYAHEGQRKIGMVWESRADQTRMRAEFQMHVDLALKLTPSASAGRGNGGTPMQGRAGGAAARQNAIEQENQRKHDLAEAYVELQTAAKLFPDIDIRDLLQGDLELSKSNWQPAEPRFRGLISRQPLVAAYHQGRALALLGLKMPMDALDEAVITVQLRSDSPTAFQLLQKAIQAVPGSELQNPKYLAAKALIDRYEVPKAPARPATGGIEWLMPGKSWQNRDNTLPIPPYDFVIAKQALAVPIGDDRLLVDAKALADAETIYVELSPGQYVRAEQVKVSAGSATPVDVPLAMLHAIDARFTPVVINPASLVAGKAAAAQAVNLYRQMGNEIRTWPAALAADGMKLEKGTLPGESTGIVFVDDGVANFVLGRIDVENPQCGPSAIIQPALLQAFLTPLIKSGAHGGYGANYSSGGVKLKATSTLAEAKGKRFFVHILAGGKPETTAGQ